MSWHRPRLRIRTLLLLVAGFAVVLWVGIVLVSPTRYLERRLRPGAPAYARRDAAGMLGGSWFVPPWEINRAVSALIRATDDPNPMVRAAAVLGLKERGDAAVRSLPALMERLKDESGYVRSVTAAVLGILAPMANDHATRAKIEEILIAARNDPDPYVRFSASQSLLDLGRDEESAVGFAELLTGDHEQTRDWASFDLMKRGMKHPLVASAIADRLEQGRPVLVESALEALTEFAPPSDLYDALQRAAMSPDPEVREAVSAHLDPPPTEPPAPR